MKKTLISTLYFFYAINLFAQANLTQEEKEDGVINYSNIKNVLKSDGLEKQVEAKKEYIKTIKKEKSVLNKGRYDIPSEEDFWAMMTRYWLVKNAQLLRWDFPKPDYGIGPAFRTLLEKFGYFNEHFKILIINSPNISHFGFPGEKGESIFILSLPFMRGLDLTKVDISLLLFEDFLRLREGYFKKNLGLKLDWIGGNFYGKSFEKKNLTSLMEKFDSVVFKKGFNFQQQFEITKKMDALLKSEPHIWSSYFKLFNKLERFIKTDLLYKNNVKIYPTPELQMNWLAPKSKKL